MRRWYLVLGITKFCLSLRFKVMDLILRVGALPVFWDINKCPVTNEHDACRVRPWIIRFLRKEGYSGPIAVTAVGELSKVSVNILEAVFSSGISLYDVTHVRKAIESLICIHYARTQTPTKVMLIAPPQSYPTSTFWEDCIFIFPMDACTTKADAKIFWQTCLPNDKCSGAEDVEPANWVCSLCYQLASQGFDNFMSHRCSSEHKQQLVLGEQEKMLDHQLKQLSPEEKCCLT